MESAHESFISETSTSWGKLSYFTHDDPIGVSLQMYGEWAGLEIGLFGELIRIGDVIIDAGANIGTHTLAFSRFTGDLGMVLAFEPQPILFHMLQRNVLRNELRNVRADNRGLGADTVSRTPCCAIDSSQHGNFGMVSYCQNAHSSTSPPARFTTIDTLALERCNFIKADVEGMELELLFGGKRTIESLRPILALEFREASEGLALFRFLADLGYRVWLHKPAAFNPDNFNRNSENVFNGAFERGYIAISSEDLRCSMLEYPRRTPILEINNPDQIIADFSKSTE